jgi:L-rhamnose-H+ transport protein
MNWHGLGITFIAGILGGSIFAPIKLLRSWKFEKSWALYSVFAYFIMPWLVALATVPRLFSIYPQVSMRTGLICAACGLGWGLAVLLFGISIKLVGLSIASAIIYGSSIAVGSLAPMLISYPQRLFSKQGLPLVLADAGVIAGVLLCTMAGKERDSALETSKKSSGAAEPSSDRRNFLKGIVASILAAFLSSLFNIALAYGGEFNRLAVAAGSSPLNAANAQWAFTVTFGYLPNVLVSIITFTRNRSWGELPKGPALHWIWPPIMGLTWIGGTALYGTGATLLGKLGPVVGWPVYMSMMIITGVLWGWILGEWKNAPRRALHYLNTGIIVQLVSIGALGLVG